MRSTRGCRGQQHSVACGCDRTGDFLSDRNRETSSVHCVPPRGFWNTYFHCSSLIANWRSVTFPQLEPFQVTCSHTPKGRHARLRGNDGEVKRPVFWLQMRWNRSRGASALDFGMVNVQGATTLRVVETRTPQQSPDRALCWKATPGLSSYLDSAGERSSMRSETNAVT
jgi:hypothetical protein